MFIQLCLLRQPRLGVHLKEFVSSSGHESQKHMADLIYCLASDDIRKINDCTLTPQRHLTSRCSVIALFAEDELPEASGIQCSSCQ